MNRSLFERQVTDDVRLSARHLPSPVAVPTPSTCQRLRNISPVGIGETKAL